MRIGVAMIRMTMAGGLCSAGATAVAGTTADAALGQPTLAANQLNQPTGSPSAANFSLNNAAHLAIAPGGRLYVSDPGNNRVLSWPGATNFVTGDAADMVFGQPDFLSGAFNNGGVSASSLGLPQGVCVDAFGDLWVCDAFNNRVLRYNDPETDATPTQADLVIGQPDFVSNQQNLGNGEHGTDIALPDGLQFPGRVLVAWPDVWIADSGNSRVLHYSAPSINKPFADTVFGQFGDFTRRAKNNDGAGNNGCCASAANLLNPIGLAIDAAGSLWVADWMNHRLVRYDEPLTSDAIADAAIGQPDFVSNSFNNGGLAAGLSLPIDIAFDDAGRLYAADSANNRVLTYEIPGNGATPDAVFGQLDNLSTNDVNHGLGFFATDADGLFGPTGVVVDSSGNILVSDTNNMRVLRFDADASPIGDLNCDDVLNLADVPAFSIALVDAAAYASEYPGCDIMRADADENGLIDSSDVAIFVQFLLNGE